MICSQHSGEALTHPAFDFSESGEQLLWKWAGDAAGTLNCHSGRVDGQVTERGLGFRQEGINIDVQPFTLRKQKMEAASTRTSSSSFY